MLLCHPSLLDDSARGPPKLARSVLQPNKQLNTLKKTMNRLCAAARSGVSRYSQKSAPITACSVHTKMRRGDDSADQPLPSLRSRLESDANAMATPSTRTTPLRSNTAAVAAWLTTHVDCQLDPETPRYIQSAMEPSSQARVVCEVDPPYRVTWASPTWYELTGHTHRGQSGAGIAGRPALALLLSAQSNSAEVGRLEESLVQQQRGCGTVACATAFKGAVFPARVTVTPLRDIENPAGDPASMLFVVKPLW